MKLHHASDGRATILSPTARSPAEWATVMSPFRRTRRAFLQFSAIGVAATTLGAAKPRHPPLNELVGINTSSFARQNRATDAAQKIDPFDVPRIMRDELDVRVIDLVSTMLATRD